MYSRFIKPLLDFSVALVILILLSPLLLLLCIFLYFANKGRIFFLQKRPGKNAQIFNIIKFKTMTDAKDNHGNLLPDHLRITKVGQMVRNLSLDELLQLINVLKGDMSLVGPRPLLPEYLPLYNAEQHKRHLVKPGITGWAQVNGRNSITWQQKFSYDVDYVKRVSFLFDLKILFLTVKKVFVREGINQDGQVTIEAFKGND